MLLARLVGRLGRGHVAVGLEVVFQVALVHLRLLLIRVVHGLNRPLLSPVLLLNFLSSLSDFLSLPFCSLIGLVRDIERVPIHLVTSTL